MEELQRAKPDIDRAVREAEAASERVRNELCTREREIRDHAQKLRRELQKQRRELQRQNRKQLERLQHELHGDWMQI